MTLISHALVTLVMTQVGDIQGRNLILAVVFGNMIDLDHVVMWKRFGMFETDKNGKKLFRGRAHSLVHEPVFAVPVALASWAFGTMIPLAFWGVHVAADHVILKSEKRPFWPVNKNWRNYGMLKLGTRAEWVIDAILVAVLVWVWGWGI